MQDLIRPSTKHSEINGFELGKRREAAGLSQRQLAALVARELGRESLSRSFIAQCESRMGWSGIPANIAMAIEKVLNV